MTSSKEIFLEIPQEFDFPFPPYNIQNEFMEKLYFALENKKLGIFESPTGTGKSLSIICGAIKWLKDRQNLERNYLTEKIAKLEIEKQKFGESTSDWLTAQSKEIEIAKELNLLKFEESKLIEYDKKIQDFKNFKEKKFNFKKDKEDVTDDNKATEEKNDEDDFLPEDSGNTQDDSSDEEESDNKYQALKIYICSRTHSQLAQLLGEIVKSPFGKNIRVATLASRQTYCINPQVSCLKNMTLINERCLDLQKKSSNQSKLDEDGKVIKRKKGAMTSCPYYRQTAIEELRNCALAEIRDVEDLVLGGKELKACPYYASRKAAEDAEIILIPYNTLLHKGTREANGIQLKNNIVIIDEAHNLLEALAQMYSQDLAYNQVYHSLLQLRSYKNKFNNRFSAKTLLLINQMIFVVSQLHQMMGKICFKSKSTNKQDMKNDRAVSNQFQIFIIS